jgi:hypothetical protein
MSKRIATFAVLGGLAFFAAGCNLQGLSLFMPPFPFNTIAPEYPLFAADKEIKLAIVAGFSQSELEIREDLRAADRELPDYLGDMFRKQCAENRHSIKLVHQAEVRNYQLKALARGELSPVELGKHFGADYVLDLNIQSLSLFEKNIFPLKFRGQAEIAMHLYKIAAADGKHEVFSKVYCADDRLENDGANLDPAMLHGAFLMKVARDISRTFVAYRPE